jgi:hypothetical protein
MRRAKLPNQPLDCNGRLLSRNDRVRSKPDYDVGFTHYGEVVRVSHALIHVKHNESCCIIGSERKIMRCAAFLWEYQG